MSKRRGLSLVVAASALSVGLLIASSVAASAATAITASPSTGLTDGATVNVNASGFADGPGALTECNNATGQPTIPVAGNDVPVSCTNPFNNLKNVTGGVFTGTFVVHTGTIGPPAQGTDSAGKNAADDAAQFPCPPTAAQAAAGASCIIAFGNANKEQATANIAFLGAASPSTTGSTAATTPSATSAPTTPATTPTTVATQVLGNQVTQPGSPPPGQVATTGPGDLTAPLAVAAVVILDLGYLSLSSTRSPRRLLRRRRRKGVVPGT